MSLPTRASESDVAKPTPLPHTKYLAATLHNMIRVPHAMAGFAAGIALGAYLWRTHDACSATTEEPAATDDNDGLLLCSLCSQRLPHEAFSAKQLRKRAGWRKPKCQACVDAYEPNSNTAVRANGHRERKPKKKEEKQEKRAAPALAQTVEHGSAAADDSQPAFDDVSDPLRKARKAEAVLRARTERVLLVLENCSDDLNHVAILRTCESFGVHRVWLVEANAGVDLPRVWGDNGQEPAVESTPPAGGNTHGPKADGTADCSVAAALADTSTAAQTRARLRLQARAAQRGFDFDPLLGVRRAQQYCTHLDVRRFPSTAACLSALREDGRTVWVTDLAQEAVPLSSDGGTLKLPLPERVAVVLGSEGAGVSEAMLAAADTRIYLPMYGFTESFNLSVSAALVLQRLLDACPESRGDLPADEMAETRMRWYSQLAKTERQQAEFEALAREGGARPLLDVRRPAEHRAEQKRYARNAETKRKLIEGGVIPSAAA